MNCRTLQDRLDAGGPAAADATGSAHLGACAGCRRDVEVAEKLEAALSEVSASTPPGFVPAVMAQVSRTPQVSAAPIPLPAAVWLPWWVRAAAQPTAVLAFAVMALLLSQADALLSATSVAGTWLSAFPAMVGAYLESLGSPVHRGLLWVGLLLGFSPLFVLLYLGLYRGSFELVLRLSGSEPTRAET